MCLQDQDIEDNNGGVRRVRRARGLSDDDGGDDGTGGLETTTEC